MFWRLQVLLNIWLKEVGSFWKRSNSRARRWSGDDLGGQLTGSSWRNRATTPTQRLKSNQSPDEASKQLRIKKIKKSQSLYVQSSYVVFFILQQSDAKNKKKKTCWRFTAGTFYSASAPCSLFIRFVHNRSTSDLWGDICSRRHLRPPAETEVPPHPPRFFYLQHQAVLQIILVQSF